MSGLMCKQHNEPSGQLWKDDGLTEVLCVQDPIRHQGPPSTCREGTGDPAATQHLEDMVLHLTLLLVTSVTLDRWSSFWATPFKLKYHV